ncbi:MAG: cysteine synthase A [Fibrobacterota bacterium]
MNIFENISECTGHTPLVRINNFIKTSETGADIFAKLEFFNPTSSIKDRTARSMIEAAEQAGDLKEGFTIVEPTSGNTGLGLAMVAAARGYRLIITMPESMSVERRRLMKQLGAEIVLTDPVKGMVGAIEKAEEIAKKTDKSFMPQQFQNAANPAVHYETTAQEIWDDTEGAVDVFVCGVGTGGTITGVGKKLKERKPGAIIVAVEPASSAVISGETPGKHGIQGIGAGFIPQVLEQEIIDEIIKVTDIQAVDTAREIAKSDGILAGISSGAVLFAARLLARKAKFKGKKIVALLPDTGERYLSTNLFEH